MIKSKVAVPALSKKKKGFWHELKKNKLLFLMILPAVLYVLVFNYLPMPGIVIAFKKYIYSKGIWGSDWVGLDNFRFLIKNGALARITTNTILYNILFITVDIVTQVGLAVILSELIGKKVKKVCQTMLLMPHFITWVVAGAMVFNILGTDYGIINSILKSQGKDVIPFMNKPELWPAIFVFFRMWKNVGYGSIVYLAAITGLDQEIYEAAEIDGANIFQRIRLITLPMIKPTIIIMLMLKLSSLIRGDFQMFYNLTGNNPILFDVTDIIDTYVFRSMTQTQNFGMSGAAGFYQSVLSFVIIMTFNTIDRKVEADYALF